MEIITVITKPFLHNDFALPISDILFLYQYISVCLY